MSLFDDIYDTLCRGITMQDLNYDLSPDKVVYRKDVDADQPWGIYVVSGQVEELVVRVQSKTEALQVAKSLSQHHNIPVSSGGSASRASFFNN